MGLIRRYTPIMAKCTHINEWGDKCLSREVPGCNLCWRHGGRETQPSIPTRKRILSAAEQLSCTYGAPVQIDHTSAIAQELWRTQGHVQWLQYKIMTSDPNILAEELWEFARIESSKEERDVNWPEAFLAIWHKLYLWERQHLLKVCTTMSSSKYLDQQSNLAEAQGVLVAAVIRGIMEDINLTEEQKRIAAESIPKRLKEVTSKGETSVINGRTTTP